MPSLLDTRAALTLLARAALANDASAVLEAHW
jgi:hypothetical protein